MNHHVLELLIALGILLFLAAVIRLVIGNPGAAHHRVRVLRWRIRLYLRPGPGYANIIELMMRWSRLRAVLTGRRSRPSLPMWAGHQMARRRLVSNVIANWLAVACMLAATTANLHASAEI